MKRCGGAAWGFGGMTVSRLGCQCSSPPAPQGASGAHPMPVGCSIGAALWCESHLMVDFGLSWVEGAACVSHTAELSAARSPSPRLTLRLSINLE